MALDLKDLLGFQFLGLEALPAVLPLRMLPPNFLRGDSVTGTGAKSFVTELEMVGLTIGLVVDGGDVESGLSWLTDWPGKGPGVVLGAGFSVRLVALGGANVGILVSSAEQFALRHKVGPSLWEGTRGSVNKRILNIKAALASTVCDLVFGTRKLSYGC